MFFLFNALEKSARRLHMRGASVDRQTTNGFSAWSALKIPIFARYLIPLVLGALFSSQTYADPVNGLTLYTAKGCTGCHAMHKNAAYAPNVISYAISTSSGGQMTYLGPGLSGADRADIADYIGTQLTDPIAQAVPYNTTTAFTIPDIDLVTGSFSSISTTSAPSKGTVSYVGTTATYIPTHGQVGADSFSYQASGPGGSSNVRTVNITIATPPAPTVAGKSVTVPYDTAIGIDLSGSISGVYTSIAVFGAAAHGTTAVSGSSITYTPTGYSGADSFTYKATGPGGTSAAATVNVTVNLPVPPTVAAKSVDVPLNISSSIDLSSSISGPTTSVMITSMPAHGSASIAGKTVTYTPATGFTGADSFAYTATGPGGTSSAATVSINVVLAPTVAPKTATIAHNTATPIDLSASISGAASSVAIASGPGHGTAAASGKIITYTPATGYIGADSFTYTATGSGGTSTPALVSLTVNPPAPISAAKNVTVAYNTATAIDVTGSISGISSSVAVASTPAHGTTSINGNVITYTPAPGYAGADSFTYTASGQGGTSTPATITITVSTPPPPTVGSKSIVALSNGVTTIDLGPSLSDATSSIAIASPPAHGTAVVNSKSIVYTPVAGFVGTDSFSYTATNPGGTSAPATVSITIVLPTAAAAASMSVAVNTPGTLDLAPFVTGSAVSGIAISTAPVHGVASVNGTKVTYTPTHNYFGADTFSYVAFGNGGTSPAAVVSVTVAGRPDPSADPDVTGLVNSQADAARRFSRAQISNFQTRMESLHRSDSGANGSDNLNASFNVQPGDAHMATTRNYGSDHDNATTQNNVRASGPAYQPAASLNANTLGSLPAAAPTASGNPASNALAAIAAATGSLPPSDPVAVLGKAVMFTETALRNSVLNLSSSTGTADGKSSLPGGVNYWIGGGLKFGSSGQSGTGTGLSFSTDGISIGADRLFSNQLALGVGLGYARDNTDVGGDGTNSKAKSFTLAAYGSYQPAPQIFLDGVVGYGSLSYQADRYVAAVNDFAHADRSGNYFFGSLTAGYEYRTAGLLLSPYGRLDLATHRLNQSTETGAGLNALTYASQTIPSVQFSLGLRAESTHQTDFGLVKPRLRVEVQHDFKGEQAASVSYADQIGGTNYAIASNATSRNSAVLGIGSDFVFRHGLTLSVDYQLQRSTDQESNQGIYLRLVKDFDGLNTPFSLVPAWTKALGIRVDAGYAFDDNVTRASAESDRVTDRSYSLNLSKNWLIPVGSNTRVSVNGFAGGEKFRTYDGLGRLYAGGDAEFQYRSSGEFDTPTYAVFGSATAEDYESGLRDGYRLSAGLSVRKPLTDRISLFGALARNIRYANSSVFSTKDYSARMNLDYALDGGSTLYISGEYRRGDIVSSGQHTLDNIDIAKVFALDDVFTRAGLYDYRFDGKTVLFTLGYNLPFGSKDSLDFSWRRAQSTPSLTPGFATSGNLRYIDNQYSIVYLTSF